MAPASSSQVPYIGSTISLLSKAGIRYEGFLHSIDQTESSVTLNHVRVFGTEDRQCDRRVPPSNEAFEYIIFRAADITELRVIDTPMSRPVPDPAIIRLQTKAAADAEAGKSGGAGGNGVGGGGGSGGARRQQRQATRGGPTNGPSGGRFSGRPNGHYQHPQQHQQLMQQSPPQMMPRHSMPMPSPRQQQQQHYQQQQQPRFRGGTDWYSLGSSGYRRGGGFYSQYRGGAPAVAMPVYAADEYAAFGYMGQQPVGGGGGRPVMQFRRYHGGGAGGRGRQSRRYPNQPQQHVAPQGNSPGAMKKKRQQPQQQQQFDADYDFETANAEMARLLQLPSAKPQQQQQHPSGEGESEAPNSNGKEADSASEPALNDVAAVIGNSGHSGYDRERSFYDDISRVDADSGMAGGGGSNGGSGGGGSAEAGGDSARPGGGGVGGGGSGRKEAARQNALNRETFGLSGRRSIGGGRHGYHHYQQQQHQFQRHQRQRVMPSSRRSPV